MILGHEYEKKVNKSFDNKSIYKYKLDIVWRNVILMIILHLGALYGMKLFLYDAKFYTNLYVILLAYCSGFGILCGAHRLWCHRSYKAKLPLQIILAIFQTMALQNDIYEWCRDHRVHHKFSETDADPHNSKRGFFFAHIGWLLCKKHPDVKKFGQTVDLQDLYNNRLVRFQQKFYIPLSILIWGYIPASIPHYFWNESWLSSFFLCVISRYVVILHMTWLVNSVAHIWGVKPYDKNINPVECKMRNFIFGEGFHNYHHTFPWFDYSLIDLNFIFLKLFLKTIRDYSASEHGTDKVFNPATLIIDMLSKIGWAYDLRKVPNEIIRKTISTSGDNKQNYYNNSFLFEWIWGIISSHAIIWMLIVFKMILNLTRNS